VIPDTALGVVFVVAAFGPGYLYLRVAEKRSARYEHSGLVEAVELAVVGAFTSTVALLAIAALANLLGIVNVHRFSAGPHAFFANHPLRVLWLLAVVVLCAYAIAYLAAHLVHWKQPATIQAGTAWTQAFDPARRPENSVIVRATIELHDGRKIEGTLGGHTTEVSDNRELLLRAPLRAQAGRDATPVTLTDTFAVLRETDVVVISGRFVAARPSDKKPPWWRRLLGARDSKRQASP
jgi:hypothetical protein